MGVTVSLCIFLRQWEQILEFLPETYRIITHESLARMDSPVGADWSPCSYRTLSGHGTETLQTQGAEEEALGVKAMCL